jgi:hypothetical protein
MMADTFSKSRQRKSWSSLEIALNALFDVNYDWATIGDDAINVDDCLQI